MAYRALALEKLSEHLGFAWIPPPDVAESGESPISWAFSGRAARHPTRFANRRSRPLRQGGHPHRQWPRGRRREQRGRPLFALSFAPTRGDSAAALCRCRESGSAMGNPGNGETQIRTGDTTIFSRVLYQLSYLAMTPAKSLRPRARSAASPRLTPVRGPPRRAVRIVGRLGRRRRGLNLSRLELLVGGAHRRASSEVGPSRLAARTRGRRRAR